MHKNTKVRQGALKLIVEICRMNYIDPRGQPFKQRIINFILGLRPSLRDPLVNKINEVCAQETKGEEEKVQRIEPFINISEMELNIATKNHRAASMDVRRGREQARVSQNHGKPSAGDLPQIGGGAATAGATVLPGLVDQANPGQTPTIVLPHSEPLTEEQKQKAEPLIQLFGTDIMTCFYS